jgi:hypothetical protein
MMQIYTAVPAFVSLPQWISRDLLHVSTPGGRKLKQSPSADIHTRTSEISLFLCFEETDGFLKKLSCFLTKLQ